MNSRLKMPILRHEGRPLKTADQVPEGCVRLIFEARFQCSGPNGPLNAIAIGYRLSSAPDPTKTPTTTVCRGERRGGFGNPLEKQGDDDFPRVALTGRLATESEGYRVSPLRRAIKDITILWQVGPQGTTRGELVSTTGSRSAGLLR